jgi:hypothetical protein
LRRKIIETLVEKVVVDGNLHFTIRIRINLLSILEEDAKSDDGKGSTGGHWPSSNPKHVISRLQESHFKKCR